MHQGLICDKESITRVERGRSHTTREGGRHCRQRVAPHNTARNVRPGAVIRYTDRHMAIAPSLISSLQYEKCELNDYLWVSVGGRGAYVLCRGAHGGVALGVKLITENASEISYVSLFKLHDDGYFLGKI